MLLVKKALSEFLGTFVLVLIGCGSAVITGGNLVATALAFGLSVVAMAYAIGDISGCHINPAISLGMLLTRRMSIKDFIVYCISQVAGAIAGSGVLAFIISSCFGYIEGTRTVYELNYKNVGLGANAFGDVVKNIHINGMGAAVVEVILTFIFVFTVLTVTSNKRFARIGGVVIGFTLTLVHILGIRLTGTSVNPARSIGPAVWLQGTALSQLWVFIAAPLVGAALAAVAWWILKPECKECKESDCKCEEKKEEATV